MQPAASAPLGLDTKDFVAKRLQPGRPRDRRHRPRPHRQGARPARPRTCCFEIRPAGRGAPRIDPKPILDGWKLLESTAIYRAASKNPFFGEDAETPTIGQILLMSKETLIQRVARQPAHRRSTAAARPTSAAGQIDRRVLATLEFLASSGLKPTVSSLQLRPRLPDLVAATSPSTPPAPRSTSPPSTASPIFGHQGPGSITDITIQRLLTLQGTMKPHQIISLMTFEGTDNTLRDGRPRRPHPRRLAPAVRAEQEGRAPQIDAILKPKQWIKLIDRLGEIDNPEVREAPSKFSLKVTRPASAAHRGE